VSQLLPMDEALERILALVKAPVAAEVIKVEQAAGRVLSDVLVATRTQPPFPASAMDGYAVRSDDLKPGTPLTLVGESAAGARFGSTLMHGTCVRILTGAPVPQGADTILIQENARIERDGGNTLIVPTQSETPGRFVRPAGADFTTGDAFFKSGHRLAAKDMALAASLGTGTISARRRPRIAVLATGNELVMPGDTPGPDQIVAANHVAVLGIAEAMGAETRFLGIAEDTMPSLMKAIRRAERWRADVLVTMGGASVGDHDLVQAALKKAGMDLVFWKIAMRPGKPLMSGMIGEMIVLGLPGNPASSIVCAELVLKPLIARLLGQNWQPDWRPGRLAVDMPENDLRREYMRAIVHFDKEGNAILTPCVRQDSSLTTILASANALLVREAYAKAAKANDTCQWLPFGG
jgi:molybdopterin molybdotransferase